MERKFPRNLQLVLSGIIVILAGLVYGLHPLYSMPLLLGFEVEAVQLGNIFRAIMGIYLGLGIYWLLGAFRQELWKSATLCNVLFMGGIASGILIGLLWDGFGLPFFVAMVLELIFMVWGFYNLKAFKSYVGK
ncbi:MULTISPECIES: DUF4345 domain-containing protein [Maribacter]|uniref:DUF4345 domain-containing protein n=1 Tax=Maribacter flavus TaxID=1658664 RepID=A0ABU7ILE8_9FLAO|nr:MULTISPECIES: DUF4345 domain-containing protein [Maribacter]MDC6406576.1 DUF4345 domain-containing protein [Maribacter sp. PR66]MEE1973694.1 DUF4345 domain-containing protein [Maribacter flavus]